MQATFSNLILQVWRGLILPPWQLVQFQVQGACKDLLRPTALSTCLEGGYVRDLTNRSWFALKFRNLVSNLRSLGAVNYKTMHASDGCQFTITCFQLNHQNFNWTMEISYKRDTIQWLLFAIFSKCFFLTCLYFQCILRLLTIQSSRSAWATWSGSHWLATFRVMSLLQGNGLDLRQFQANLSSSGVLAMVTVSSWYSFWVSYPRNYDLLWRQLAYMLNDTYEFDTSEMIWTDITKNLAGAPPSPRSRHGMASSNGYIYVFGGSCANGEIRHMQCKVLGRAWKPLDFEQFRRQLILTSALKYPSGRRSLMSTRI